MRTAAHAKAELQIMEDDGSGNGKLASWQTGRLAGQRASEPAPNVKSGGPCRSAMSDMPQSGRTDCHCDMLAVSNLT